MSNHQNLAQDFWRFQGPARGDLTPWQFIICLPSCATSLPRGRLWLCMSQLCKAGNYHDVQIYSTSCHEIPAKLIHDHAISINICCICIPCIPCKGGLATCLLYIRAASLELVKNSGALPSQSHSYHLSPHALGTSKQQTGVYNLGTFSKAVDCNRSLCMKSYYRWLWQDWQGNAGTCSSSLLR